MRFPVALLNGSVTLPGDATTERFPTSVIVGAACTVAAIAASRSESRTLVEIILVQLIPDPADANVRLRDVRRAGYIRAGAVLDVGVVLNGGVGVNENANHLTVHAIIELRDRRRTCVRRLEQVSA